MVNSDDKQVSSDKKIEVLISLCEIYWTNFDHRRSYEWKLGLAVWAALTAFIALVLKGDVTSPPWPYFVLAASLIVMLQMLFLYCIKHANDVDKFNALKCEEWLYNAIDKKCEDKRINLLKFFKGWWSIITHIGITLVLVFAAGFVLYWNVPIIGEKSMSNSISVFSILIPVAVALVAFGGGLATWFLNERSKRVYEEYKRKEEKYLGLIRGLRGFYVGSENSELKTEFLNQLNLCWMYCPDEVIHKAYNFLNMVHTERKHSDEEKEKAVGEFMLAIRQDLINRKPLRKTSLKSEDFKHLKAT